MDSVSFWADSALVSATNSDDYAEALTHKAFVCIQRMQYPEAEALIDTIQSTTKNQLTLLTADLLQMRICQRESRNKAFYECRQMSQQRIKRIVEEQQYLTSRDSMRLLFCVSEFHIVSIAYYYYVGLKDEYMAELNEINVAELQHGDIQQFLAYLYNNDNIDINVCLNVSRGTKYIYWQANALQETAVKMQQLDLRHATANALMALDLFSEYGDLYQTYAATRTLAQCHFYDGNYQLARSELEGCLTDSVINRAPALLSSIYENLSLVYAALDNKAESDHYRNLYIDLHEETRQDRQLEARAEQYAVVSQRLNIILVALFITFVVVLLLIIWFSKRKKDHIAEKEIARLSDSLEEVQEQVETTRYQLEKGELRLIDNRAKVSALLSIAPLIDRLRNAAVREGHEEYALELINKIDEDNNKLTQWIQLRKGALRVKIESFPLQPIFDTLAMASNSMRLKGIQLIVKPTTLSVKADRVLTLFMLNTLTDNARRFTHEGGTITVEATESADSVVLSVSDTGDGMTEEETSNIFNHGIKNGHGFGLMNCRGIIEQYRKTSSFFQSCSISVKSVVGKGSTFCFSLPKVVKALVAALMLAVPAVAEDLNRANSYADSAYFSNINGTYEHTLVMADSCLRNISSRLFVVGPQSSEPLELQWFSTANRHNPQDSLRFVILLDIRNEAAVAALALHRWQVYNYNNAIYTRLYKEMSTDDSLKLFCSRMSTVETDLRIAAILLALLIISIIPLWYVLYYRKQLNRRVVAINDIVSRINEAKEQQQRLQFEYERIHVTNNIVENQLSAIKHETMYYPSRLKQLLVMDDKQQLVEVSEFYSRLYNELLSNLVDSSSCPLNLKRLYSILDGMLHGHEVVAEQTESELWSYRISDRVDDIEFRNLTQLVRDIASISRCHSYGVVRNADDVVVTVGKALHDKNC